MALKTVTQKIPAAAGGAGGATANVAVEVEPCRLVAVEYIFAGSEAATTVVTVKDKFGTIVAAVAAGNTSKLTQPSVAARDNAGAATTTLVPPVLDGTTTLTTTLANAGDAPVVKLIFDAI